MKTIITTSSTAKTGYELRITDEQGKVTVKAIDKFYPGEPTTLVLPENPTHRQYFSTKKLEEVDELELTVKEPRKLGPRLPGNGSTKKLLDYLTDEERKVYDNLVEVAKKRRDEDKKKPMSEVDKAKAAYERAKAKYEAMAKAAEEAKGE